MLKARVLAGDEWGDAKGKAAVGETEKEVIIEIAPEALKKATRATIAIKGATSGGEAKVTLLVKEK